MLDDGKGTLIAESETERIWWEEEQGVREHIKQLKFSIKKNKENLKKSARLIHKEYQTGIKNDIKNKKLILKIKKDYLVFCGSKIKKH